LDETLESIAKAKLYTEKIMAPGAKLRFLEKCIELQVHTLEQLQQWTKVEAELEDACLRFQGPLVGKYQEWLERVRSRQMTYTPPSEWAEFHAACNVKASEVPHWQIVPTSWMEKWQDFCSGRGEALGPLSTIEITEELSSDKYFTEKPQQRELKSGLVEEKDFKLLPYSACQILTKAYGSQGPSLLRRMVKLTDKVSQVEVFLFCIKVLVLPQATTNPLPAKTLMMSKRSSLKQAKDKVVRLIQADFKQGQFKVDVVRYWRLDALTDFEALKKTAAKPKSVVLGGSELEEAGTLGDVGLAEGDVLMLEFKKANDTWHFLSEKEASESCAFCQTHFDLKLCSACKIVKYCSAKCQSRHFPIHKLECKRPKAQKEAAVRQGMVGLRNLGNTCFMNSALQCLFFTEPLTQYFTSNRYRDELNMKNPIGTGGALAIAYAELLREVKSESKAVIPSYFKRILEKFAPQFSGYMQHDSQELLNYVLDGLHEDLNRVVDKPFTEALEFGSDQSNEEAAQSSWSQHLKRNESAVVDLMHGQYKSTLVCPNCSRVSVTFDPFLTFSLQIPSKETRRQIVYFVSLNSAELPLEITAELVMSSRLEELRGLLGGVTGSTHFLWAAVSNNLIKSFPSDSKELCDVKFSSLFAFETPSDRSDFLPVQVVVTREADKRAGMMVECAYSHLLIAYREDTLVEVHLKVMRLFKTFIEANLKRTVTEEEVELLAPKAYSVFVVKPHHFKAKAACPLCSRKPCKRCPLPFNSEVTVRALLEMTGLSADDFSLEIEWSLAIKDFKAFTLCTRYEQLLKSPGLVSSTDITLFDCLRQSALPEKLDRDNTWYCNLCKEHVQATKTYQLFRLPEILMIHLKRFKSRGMWNEKLNSFVDFPVSGLDLSEYALGAQQHAPIYDLYAVSNHYGGMGGGHYTAFVKRSEDGQWFEMDDGLVSPAGRVVTPAAYILCYRRRS
jgi:ubiquitin carboxyl-terminal hydrolase 4/11/15